MGDLVDHFVKWGGFDGLSSRTNRARVVVDNFGVARRPQKKSGRPAYGFANPDREIIRFASGVSGATSTSAVETGTTALTIGLADYSGQKRQNAMSKQIVTPSWKLCVSGFGLLLIATNAAISMEDSSPAVCTAREVEIRTLLGGNGETGDLTPDKLAEVSLIMSRAGAACYEGRVGEAVALYDGILALGTILGRPTQSRTMWVPESELRNDHQISPDQKTAADTSARNGSADGPQSSVITGSCQTSCIAVMGNPSEQPSQWRSKASPR